MYTGQVDHSIYFNQKAPDIMGSIERGMTLGKMIKEKRDQEAIREAYSAGMTMKDGKPTFDAGITMSALGKGGYGQQAYELSQKMAEQERLAQDQKRQNEDHAYLKKKREIDTVSNLLYDVKDQQSYDRARMMAAQNGVDVSGLPRAYDPGYVNNLKMSAFSAKERMDQYYKQRELGQKDTELGIKANEARSKAKSGESLPLDSKKMVEGLSTKNANKIAIKNQIDAVLSSWDSLSDDQKVTSGRQLLKTLNSTEGADAIGAEEANRLGAKLEFALGNLTPWNSNPIQFGRDLSGFKEQASNVSKSIGTAIKSNQDIIDEKMGRSIKKSNEGQSRSSTPIFKTSEIEW